MTTTATIPDAAPAQSPGQRSWRRLRQYPAAWVGTIVFSLIVLTCYLSMPWTLYGYKIQNLNAVLQAPGAEYWLGTDSLGRSLLERLLLGGSVSIAIGLASATIAVLLGTGVGLVAGYFGGLWDSVLMRVVDVLYGLPYILLVIMFRIVMVPLLTKALSPYLDGASLVANFMVLLVGIGAVSWLTMARVIRGQALALRQMPFVEAARAMGMSHRSIILRHILPNLMGPIFVYAALTVPQAILAESFLSFLGLGISAPLPSWGNLAAEGVDAMNPVKTYWWLVTSPAVLLSLTLICLNFVGDALRDALDPKGNQG
ncbi:MAG: ABC transporter permease [Phycisphaerae bacterium]